MSFRHYNDLIMERHPLPEVIFAGDALLRRLDSARIRLLAPRVYTTNMVDDPVNIVRRHLLPILSHLFPGAVISHRSAFELRPSEAGEFFLTYKYTRRVEIPGLVVRLLEGPGHQEGDMPMLDMYKSSDARALLENLQHSRARVGGRKTIDRKSLEEKLDSLCRLHGEEALNHVCDTARSLAPALGLKEEFRRLDRIIGAILRTHDRKILTAHTARARSAGLPYDPARLELFSALAAHLTKSAPFPIHPAPRAGDSFSTSAFFDAYFSNYIEGTTFTLEEAEGIVFDKRVVMERPADSHDILATFGLLVNDAEMRRLPASSESFEQILRYRHSQLMSARPEIAPGQFKSAANYAGNTEFVSPELVVGTLRAGFGFYQGLTDPFARAAYMMFLVAEVHPFRDGNGRLARLMMNADLHAASAARIIIPTVFRDNYLAALRSLSRTGDPGAYVRMLSYAWQFTSEIDFSDRSAAVVQMARCNAFSEDEANDRLLLPGALPLENPENIRIPPYFSAHLKKWLEQRKKPPTPDI